MSKLLSTVVVLLFPLTLVAMVNSETPAEMPRQQYNVTLELRHGNQSLGTSQIVVLEGEDGEIEISKVNKEEYNKFSVIVHQITSDQINLSYRFKRQQGPSKIDFARSDIAMEQRLPLIVQVQDNLEDEFEMKISVKPN